MCAINPIAATTVGPQNDASAKVIKLDIADVVRKNLYLLEEAVIPLHLLMGSRLIPSTLVPYVAVS